MSKDFKKVLVGFDEDTITGIDEFATRMAISRAAAIRLLCNQSLQAQRTMTSLDDLMIAYKAEQAKQVLSAGARSALY